MEAATEDCVIHPFPEWPGDQVYEGRAGWRLLINEWIENFEDLMWDIDRLVDLDDRVLVCVVHRGFIKGARLPVSQPLSLLCGNFRDGSVGTADFFMTWEEGLKAAGLSE